MFMRILKTQLIYLFLFYPFFAFAQSQPAAIDTLKAFWKTNSGLTYGRSIFYAPLDDGHQVSVTNPIDANIPGEWVNENSFFKIKSPTSLPGKGEELWPYHILDLANYKTVNQSANNSKELLIKFLYLNKDFKDLYHIYFDEHQPTIKTTHCFDGHLKRGPSSATLLAVAKDKTHLKLINVLTCYDDGWIYDTYKYEFLVTDIKPMAKTVSLPTCGAGGTLTPDQINQENCFSAEEYESHSKIIKMPSWIKVDKIPAISSGAVRKTYEEAWEELKYTLNRFLTVKNVDFNGRKSTVFEMIRSVSATYDVATINVLAAILGEHSFNMSFSDTIQQRLLRWQNKWKAVSTPLHLFLQLEQSACQEMNEQEMNEYETWTCLEKKWISHYQGKKRPDYCDRPDMEAACSGNVVKNHGLKFTFFSPFGGTYGLGQLGPEAALKVADLVAEKNEGNLPQSDDSKMIATDLFYLNRNRKELDGNFMYESILDKRLTVHYVAAMIKRHQEFYAHYANFDISKNAGLNTTLYNLGKADTKAQTLYSENYESLKAFKKITRVPELNFMGYLVNLNIQYICETVGFGKDIDKCMEQK